MIKTKLARVYVTWLFCIEQLPLKMFHDEGP